MHQKKIHGLRVLLALENEQVARGLKHMLLSYGVSSSMAVDNRRATNLMATETYNIIVTNESFPKLGGADFTRFIRLTDKPMAIAPIIYGLEMPSRERVLEARDAGATKVVAMPFTVTGLMKAISLAMTDGRPIVQHTSYSGPDRRIANDTSYIGPERRYRSAAVISWGDQLNMLRSTL
ncbi:MULTISPECIES: hypothetical protein [Kordiimonas]|uniref:hypothetical protein n=1 Tax=Kordiimonas TaxID=288021 RepID=UPI00257F68D1|nr:hypothetical protein [Kordiimonas sp. UBA4487]